VGLLIKALIKEFSLRWMLFLYLFL